MNTIFQLIIIIAAVTALAACGGAEPQPPEAQQQPAQASTNTPPPPPPTATKAPTPTPLPPMPTNTPESRQETPPRELKLFVTPEPTQPTTSYPQVTITGGSDPADSLPTNPTSGEEQANYHPNKVLVLPLINLRRYIPSEEEEKLSKDFHHTEDFTARTINTRYIRKPSLARNYRRLMEEQVLKPHWSNVLGQEPELVYFKPEFLETPLEFDVIYTNSQESPLEFNNLDGDPERWPHSISISLRFPSGGMNKTYGNTGLQYGLRDPGMVLHVANVYGEWDIQPDDMERPPAGTYNVFPSLTDQSLIIDSALIRTPKVAGSRLQHKDRKYVIAFRLKDDAPSPLSFESVTDGVSFPDEFPYHHFTVSMRAPPDS